MPRARKLNRKLPGQVDRSLHAEAAPLEADLAALLLFVPLAFDVHGDLVALLDVRVVRDDAAEALVDRDRAVVRVADAGLAIRLGHDGDELVTLVDLAVAQAELHPLGGASDLQASPRLRPSLRLSDELGDAPVIRAAAAGALLRVSQRGQRRSEEDDEDPGEQVEIAHGLFLT